MVWQHILVFVVLFVRFKGGGGGIDMSLHVLGTRRLPYNKPCNLQTSRRGKTPDLILRYKSTVIFTVPFYYIILHRKLILKKQKREFRNVTITYCFDDIFSSALFISKVYSKILFDHLFGICAEWGTVHNFYHKKNTQYTPILKTIFYFKQSLIYTHLQR